MGISDISASLFQATAAASVQTKPAAVKIDGKGGPGGPSSPADTVAFSDLATALKGDALDLFNSLSSDDRKVLAGFVSNGALSADELNGALSSALKTQRKAAFWEAVGEDAAGVSGGVSGGVPQGNNVRPDRPAAPQRPGRDREEQLVRQAVSAADAAIGQPLRSYGLRGEDRRFFASTAEQAAGEKLAGLGFRSSAFDQAVSAQAKDFARTYLQQEGRTTMTLRS